jgi:N-acyl-L-homoserine lactone synthetase
VERFRVKNGIRDISSVIQTLLERMLKKLGELN